jgi:hypothetical protein
MTYFDDSYQGVGAIAAAAPAPRSAPAPTVGRLVAGSVPREIAGRPRVSVPLRRPKSVYPGVRMTHQAVTRPGMVLSGKRKVVPWTGVLRDYGTLKRRPSGLMVAPAYRPPDVLTAPPPRGFRPRVGSANQIGTGIGTPRVSSLPVRPAFEPSVRTAGAPVTGPEFDDAELALLESQVEPPAFQPEPTPEKVAAKPISTKTLLVLGGVAAVGVYLLMRAK